MVSSLAVVAIAPFLLAAVEAVDSLVIGSAPTGTGAHIGDALTVAYSAPNNEIVTLGLVTVSTSTSTDHI